MADSYIGEIRILPYTYAPANWAWCNGQTMPANQYQALYVVLQNAYGGNTTQFNLPNLQTTAGQPGCAPMGTGAGPGLTPRQLSPNPVGTAAVSLAPNQMPMHNHGFNAQNAPVTTNIIADPTNAWLARGLYDDATPSGFFTYAPDNTGARTAFRGPAVSTAGGGQPHENRQPFLVMSFCISLYGEFPVRPT